MFKDGFDKWIAEQLDHLTLSFAGFPKCSSKLHILLYPIMMRVTQQSFSETMTNFLIDLMKNDALISSDDLSLQSPQTLIY